MIQTNLSCPSGPRASLDRMGAESMEIYQIHWPFGAMSSRYWDGLADCVDQGLVKVRRRGGGRRGSAFESCFCHQSRRYLPAFSVVTYFIERWLW